MTILILAEQQNGQLNPAVLNCVTAAQAIGGEISLLLAGEELGESSQQAAQIAGVERVYVAQGAAYQGLIAENMALLVQQVAEKTAAAHILAPATTSAKNILPRAAALLDVGAISDISAVISADTFERPIYAGNAIAKVQSHDPIKVISVRTTSFEPCAATGGAAAVEMLEMNADAKLSRFVEQRHSSSDRPELTSAKIVVSGGRGMGSAENFSMLENIADKLNAAVGASRAAVDAGYVPNDYQVGQTGKVVAPDLYIAVGISGAIQHLAGMKDSKVIVAINKDDEAPIFQVADYGLVADLFEALPELDKSL